MIEFNLPGDAGELSPNRVKRLVFHPRGAQAISGKCAAWRKRALKVALG